MEKNMMEQFWNGFEKRAEEPSEKKKSGLKSILGSVLLGNFATKTMGIVNSKAMNKIVKSSGTLNEKERTALINTITKDLKINPRIERPILGRELASNYNWINDTAAVGGNEAILAHELGHASSKANNGKILTSLRKGVQAAAPITRILSTASAPIAWGIAGSNLSEDFKDKAAYVPLALAAPVLTEEAIATGIGTRQLYKHKGAKSALKSLKTSLPAYSTYLLPPLLATGLAKAIIKKRREESGRINNGKDK